MFQIPQACDHFIDEGAGRGVEAQHASTLVLGHVQESIGTNDGTFGAFDCNSGIGQHGGDIKVQQVVPGRPVEHKDFIRLVGRHDQVAVLVERYSRRRFQTAGSSGNQRGFAAAGRVDANDTV